MSVEAIKVNELMEEAAVFCETKAQAVRDFVNDEVREPSFLAAAEEAADSLKEAAREIRNWTLDEDEDR